MSESEILEIITDIRFLEGVQEAELRKIASMATLVDFPEGTVVFREGERTSRVYVVVGGSVGLELKVSNEGKKRIHTVGPGELLGWSPLLGESPMTATGRTLSSTKLLALEAGQVLALCHHDPKLGFQLMRKTAQALAQRLNATRLHLLDVYGQEIPLSQGNF